MLTMKMKKFLICLVGGICLAGGIMMLSNSTTKKLSNNYSHDITASLEKLEQEARERIEDYKGTEFSKKEMHLMLDQLLAHPVGKAVFISKGLNGENIQYFIGGAPTETNPMIRWFCDRSPVVLATRERFGIFQKELQKRLKDNAHFASIPFGFMNDLLKLDITGKQNIHFTGIDLDPESLMLATKNANERGYKDICSFKEADAWKLSAFTNMFDLVTSNGLNIYVKEDAKVTELYKELFKILKPGGTLITSFLVPPALVSQDATKQRIILGTIIGIGWQNFRTEELTRKQLAEAGFVDVEIIYDSQRMFPTVIAKKPAT